MKKEDIDTFINEPLEDWVDRVIESLELDK